jgi:choline-sulfatase
MGRGSIVDEHVMRKRPQVWIELCALAALCACGGAPTPAEPTEVVALITLDSWRYDHFNAIHTPNLWALSEEGERFTQAHSPMGLTSPAHATMLSGLPPWEHGLEANNHHGYSLDPNASWLPSTLEGWRKGAFVSAWPAGPSGGLDRGFDVFSGPPAGERSSVEAVGEALAFLDGAVPRDGRAGQKTFLWVHLYEPHGPYEGQGATEAARYGEEVRRADARVGPLLTRLRALGARIVVAADHGEVLEEERCRWQHERSSHPVVLHVPLFRWEPGRVARADAGLHSLADVRTLLEGGDPPSRAHVLAQSGICEPGCSGGCTPAGVSGRDRVVISATGQWVQRPGVGTHMVGLPPGSDRALLGAIPDPGAPEGVDEDALERLGYTTP